MHLKLQEPLSGLLVSGLAKVRPPDSCPLPALLGDKGLGLGVGTPIPIGPP